MFLECYPWLCIYLTRCAWVLRPCLSFDRVRMFGCSDDRMIVSTSWRQNSSASWRSVCKYKLQPEKTSSGGLAQMVERSLSMREVLGSMPRFSNLFDSLGTLFHPRYHPLHIWGYALVITVSYFSLTSHVSSPQSASCLIFSHCFYYSGILLYPVPHCDSATMFIYHLSSTTYHLLRPFLIHHLFTPYNHVVQVFHLVYLCVNCS